MYGDPVRISPGFDELTKYGIDTTSQSYNLKQWPQIVDSCFVMDAITLNATIKYVWLHISKHLSSSLGHVTDVCNDNILGKK